VYVEAGLGATGLGLYLMRFDTPWLTDVFHIEMFHPTPILGKSADANGAMCDDG
jgi:hypothetical protein